MSKKKKKDFNYSNSKNSKGYYAPYPYAGQRYPHTNLHQVDSFWIYEELGILKDWLISLTKLYGMIAQLETNDAIKLASEIRDLISKLIAIIKAIADALEELYSISVDYDNAIEEGLKCIKDTLELFYTILMRLPQPVFELLSCIEDRLVKDDKNIYDIANYLENMMNAKSTTLTEGKDFTVTFFNGYKYSDDRYDGEKQSMLVTLTTTELLEKKFYEINVQCGHSSSTAHAITNDYVYTADSANDSSAPIFSHGSGWRSHPTCWLFMIKFIGDYSFLNDLTDSTFSQGNSNSIFNMRPLAARPSWAVNIDAAITNVYTEDGSIQLGNGIIFILQNIADGINSQYYTYCTMGLSDSISFGDSLSINLIINTHE